MLDSKRATRRVGRRLRRRRGDGARLASTTARSSSPTTRPQTKAFYMQPDPNRPEVVLAADLIAPEGYGEICGGSQRIHDLALMRAADQGARPARGRPSSGTSTCANTAPCPTPASAWASSAWWPGSAACRTCGRRSLSPHAGQDIPLVRRGTLVHHTPSLPRGMGFIVLLAKMLTRAKDMATKLAATVQAFNLTVRCNWR